MPASIPAIVAGNLAATIMMITCRPAAACVDRVVDDHSFQKSLAKWAEDKKAKLESSGKLLSEIEIRAYTERVREKWGFPRYLIRIAV
jgi:hypothetical protein